MLTIGLTGGIASGKTTVSDLFAGLGVAVVDTDVISRQLLEIDQPCYDQVLQHFGNGILLKNRAIDRAQLRRLVFNDELEKCWLEEVLHPVVYRQTRQLIEKCNNNYYVLVVIPLLFESNFGSLVDRVLVIDCSPDTQIVRLISRDDIDRELAQKMLDQQWSNSARLEQADDVICNDANLDLGQQVANLHARYLLLAGKSPD
jgi:dephospho-CoA kinase